MLDVIDDGPGFGQGPPGAASLGLGVVTTLLESCGGTLEIRAAATGGVHVRIIVPVRPVPPAPIPGGTGQVVP
jgi:signal transduction histidine kinase